MTRPVHYMTDDLEPACGSQGDAGGVLVSPVPGDVSCPDCRPQATLGHG